MYMGKFLINVLKKNRETETVEKDKRREYRRETGWLAALFIQKMIRPLFHFLL